MWITEHGTCHQGNIRQSCSACCAESLSPVRLCVTPCTVAHQAPLSIEILNREYGSGLPCPPPGDLPNPGINSRSPALHTCSLLCKPPEVINYIQIQQHEGFSSGSLEEHAAAWANLNNVMWILKSNKQYGIHHTMSVHVNPIYIIALYIF